MSPMSTLIQSRATLLVITLRICRAMDCKQRAPSPHRRHSAP